MYDAVIDSYCYEGTTVLKNIPGIHDQSSLEACEAIMSTQRSDEPLPSNLNRLVPKHFMTAMIASFEKDEEKLTFEIKELLR